MELGCTVGNSEEFGLTAWGIRSYCQNQRGIRTHSTRNLGLLSESVCYSESHHGELGCTVRISVLFGITTRKIRLYCQNQCVIRTHSSWNLVVLSESMCNKDSQHGELGHTVRISHAPVALFKFASPNEPCIQTHSGFSSSA